MIINRGPTAAEVNAYLAAYGTRNALNEAWGLCCRGDEHFLPREAKLSYDGGGQDVHYAATLAACPRYMLGYTGANRLHRCSLGYADVWLRVFQKHRYGVLSLTQEGRTVSRGPEAVDVSVGRLRAMADPRKVPMPMLLVMVSQRGRTSRRLRGNELDIGRQLERLRLLQDDLFGFVADACAPCTFQLIGGRGERGARFKASVARLRDHRLRDEVARCAALPKPLWRAPWDAGGSWRGTFLI